MFRALPQTLGEGRELYLGWRTGIPGVPDHCDRYSQSSSKSRGLKVRAEHVKIVIEKNDEWSYFVVTKLKTRNGSWRNGRLVFKSSWKKLFHVTLLLYRFSEKHTPSWQTVRPRTVMWLCRGTIKTDDRNFLERTTAWYYEYKPRMYNKKYVTARSGTTKLRGFNQM